MAKVVKMSSGSKESAPDKTGSRSGAGAGGPPEGTVNAFGLALQRTHVMALSAITVVAVLIVLWSTLGRTLLPPAPVAEAPDVSSPERPAGSAEDAAARQKAQERRAGSDGNSYQD